MPPPLDLAQERADAEVEATAFQNSIDQLVSRYEVLMENLYDPEPDPEADPQEELSRLRSLGDELELEIRELGALHSDLVGAYTPFHKHIYALPKEGRIRVDFTAAFNKFMQEHNVTASTKGALKRIDELRSLYKVAANNSSRLRQSLPENQLNFDLESEEDSSDGDYVQPLEKGSAEPSSSHGTSKVPAGTSSSRKATADTHTEGTKKPSSHERSAEHTRRSRMNSVEFDDSSKHATDGSAEPPAGKPSSPTSVFGLFKSTFQRPTTKTSPPERSSSPLRFNADGTSRRKTTSDAHKLYTSAVKTGADFSVYNNNPFYTNSCVKLPIRPTECVPAGTDKYPAPPPLIFKGIIDAPFTGDIRSYPNWRDAFIHLVHAPGRIMQDSERLLYLKQCLKGAPLDLIDRYPINDRGYQFATMLLESRFYNLKRALFSLRQDLQAVRPPANSYNELLRFQQDLVHICGNFLQAGEDIGFNDLYFDIVMAKLPLTVRCTFSQRKRDQGDTSPWSIDQLLEELQRSLDIMSDAYLYEEASPQPAGSRSRPNRPLAFGHPHGSSAERTGGGFVGAIHEGPMSQSCAFCGDKGTHWASDCPKYATISDRYERAKGRHHLALCPTFVTKRRKEAQGQPKKGKKKKKASNRDQRGSRQANDDRQGCYPHRAPNSGGDTVAPGDSTLHGTDRGTRRPDEGRAQIHAAAIGNEEATTQTNGRPPVYKEDSGAGPRGSPQQPAGSHSDADSYAYDSVHLFQTNGQESRPTKDDDTFSVVTHDSDAPTEPEMEEQFTPYDLSCFGGYAAAGSTHASTERTHATFLECVMATVFNPSTKKNRKVYAFLDSGSTGSFVRKEVAQQLGLPNFGHEPLYLDTSAQDRPTRIDTFRTHIGFKQIDGSSLVLDLKASPKLVQHLEAVFVKPSDEAFLRRNQYELVPQYIVPDILIGRNHRHLFLPDELRPPLPNGFTLLRTTLGMILTGSGEFKQRLAGLARSTKESADSTCPSTARHVSAETPTVHVTPSKKEVRFSDAATARAAVDEDSSETHAHGSADPPDGRSTLEAHAEATHLSVFFARPHHDVAPAAIAHHFWQTESIGIEIASRNDNDVIREHIKKNICLAKDGDGRYQISLPWKTTSGEPPSSSDIPTHLGLAISHLGWFQKEHRHRPEVLHTYGHGLHQMEADGDIEKFNPSDNTIRFLHFYTHHVDFSASTSAQMQAIFDGSAKLDGTPSINDYLHGSEFALPTTVGITLRTRLHRFAVHASIAQSLRQLTLNTRDRSACAFIWFKDPNRPPRPDNLVYYRFKRFPLDLKPSGLMLEALARFHLEHQGPLAEELWRNCHQHSVIFSGDTLANALEKYRGTKALFAAANMRVQQFVSNCPELNKQFLPQDVGAADCLKKFGYKWHISSDNWHVSYASQLEKAGTRKRMLPRDSDGRLTKRIMLLHLHSVSDPLGLTTPAIVAAKLVFQQSFKLPLKWDDPLGYDIQTSWSKATRDFATTVFEIPRHICARSTASIELHICVDASKDTYGFAAYIRNVIFIKEQLFQSTITRVTIWSDSVTVLKQLRNPAKPKDQWLNDRLTDIRHLQSQVDFDTCYVQPSDNPGQLAARGIPAAALQSSKLWWHGIPFFVQPSSTWPAQPEQLLAHTTDIATTTVHFMRVSSCPAGHALAATARGFTTLTQHGIASADAWPAGGLPTVSAENFQFQAAKNEHMERGRMEYDQLVLQSAKEQRKHEPHERTRGRDEATPGPTVGRHSSPTPRPSEIKKLHVVHSSATNVQHQQMLPEQHTEISPAHERPPSRQMEPAAFSESRASADATKQAASIAATDSSTNDSTAEDEAGSLIQTDEESQPSDNYEEPSHGLDWF